MRNIIACLLLLLLICGCNHTPAPQTQPATTETVAPTTEPETVPPTTTEPPRITVYPGAVEYYKNIVRLQESM